MITDSTPLPAGFKQWIRDPRVAISAGFLLLFYFTVKVFEAGPPPIYPWLNLYPQTALLLICMVMVGFAWFFQGKNWLVHLLAHLFAYGFATATVLIWQGLEFGPQGISGDSWFTTAMITKFKEYGGSQDFVYKGLHSYYPSLFHYLSGRIANWTHTAPWTAFKYGGYWASMLLPLFAFHLWRKILPSIAAFLMVVLSMAICRHYILFKPYEILSLVTFLPWALYYIGGVRFKVEEGKYSWEWGQLTRKDMIWGGIMGGLIFMTFYYYFFLLITWVPVRLLMDWRREGSLSKALKGFFPLLGLIGVMMVVSAVYWMPMMIDIFKYGIASFQNRWFQPHMLSMPLDAIHSWELVLGILVLVGLSPMNRLAQAVLGVFVALVGFMFLGHIGMYANFPLLHIRMVGIEEYLSKLGLVLGGLLLLTQFKGMRDKNWLLAFPVMIAVMFSLNMAMEFSWDANRDNRNVAVRTKKPMLVGIVEFTQLCKDKVFLTNRFNMLSYRPMFSFICHNAHFSHPAARFRQRLKFLKLLSGSQNSDFVAWMLQYNEFEPVDHIMLDDNHTEVFDDNFPSANNHIKVDIEFGDSIFQGQYFKQHESLKEIQTALPVPAELWKTFDKGEMRLAALFAKQDREAIRSQFSAAELKQLDDEIRIRTTEYDVWQRVFWSRFGG